MSATTKAEINQLFEANKRINLPQHVSRPRKRMAHSVEESEAPGQERGPKTTAFKKPSVTVLYTNTDVLTSEKVSELRIRAANERPHIMAIGADPFL